MSKTLLKDCVEILDSQRIPLSSAEREKLDKVYPYYGAQGIIDYVDRYIFDGEYILVAEDGNNLKSLSANIATWATGQFWVNNHAHILGEKPGYCLRYIYYILNSLDLRGYITGSAQPKFNQENLARVELDLPDYETQCDIAEALTAVDSKISNNTAICSDLEAMVKLLDDYWFVQFDFPDENGKPYKSSGGKMVWNDELKREIPEGWEVKALSDIGSLQQNSVFPESGVKYSHYSIPAFDESRMPASEDGEDIASNKYLVPEGSVLVSKLNPQFKRIWLILYAQYNAICSTEFLPVQAAKTGIYYLYSLLNTDAFSVHLKQKASSSTGSRKRIDPENVMSFQFAYDERIATLFNEKVASFFNQANQMPMENQQLASLRDFLLPMLMNGQVKVKK